MSRLDPSTTMKIVLSFLVLAVLVLAWQLKTQIDTNRQHATQIRELNDQLAKGVRRSNVDAQQQERCGKRAEQIFAKNWPHGSPDNSAGYTTTAFYTSHYNAKLNKCFMLETSQGYDPKRPFVMKFLLDANSNKEYGQFFKSIGFPPTCNLGDQICSSEPKWDAMARVYMEEDAP
jgi:hypothetical protein